MTIRRTLVAGFGVLAATLVWGLPASAQFRGNEYPVQYQRQGGTYQRGYDGDRGYDRRDGYRDDRGRYGGRDERYGRGGRGAPDPLAGMSPEKRARAIENHRRAQKKAYRNGVIIP